VIDGVTPATDRFRMRIWDKARGDAIVFDNMPGAAEAVPPTTPVVGGYIMLRP